MPPPNRVVEANSALAALVRPLARQAAERARPARFGTGPTAGLAVRAPDLHPAITALVRLLARQSAADWLRADADDALCTMEKQT